MNHLIAPGLKSKEPATFEDILKIVADKSGVTVEDILSPTRKKPVALARHLLCLLCREHTNHSFKDIGALTGKRDHSSAIHSTDTALDLIDTDQRIKELHQSISREISVMFSPAPPERKESTVKIEVVKKIKKPAGKVRNIIEIWEPEPEPFKHVKGVYSNTDYSKLWE